MSGLQWGFNAAPTGGLYSAGGDRAGIQNVTHLGRRALIGAGLLLACGGMGAGGAAFAYTNAATDAAVRFFRTLARQGAKAGYAETSTDYRAAVSEAAFVALVERTGLRGFRSVRWLPRSVSFGAVEMAAELTLAGDRPEAMVIRIARGSDGSTWRVAALDVSAIDAHGGL